MELECTHENVICLNHYEIIRKYRCEDCGDVMMCVCDEEFGRKFLSHQLDYGIELETQRRIRVTIGFQQGICRECRGLKPEAHPKAEIFGMTSKIRRYYWREIYIQTTQRFAKWAETAGYTDLQLARSEHPEKFKDIEKETLTHINELHRTEPKYEYDEKSQSDLLLENKFEVVELYARHLHGEEGNLVLDRDGVLLSPEGFVQAYLKDQGFDSLFCESIPFHVLFGVFMWILIQDPSDSHQQIRGFGRRDRLEETDTQMIQTLLPTDFGSSGYFFRRKNEIMEHLNGLPRDKDGLFELFDYWLPFSEDLRQYLWAYNPAKVKTARQILEILSATDIISIMEYLVADYWRRYLGWPDLLAFNNNNFIFIEVKSSGDRLSETQKQWVSDNSKILHLPFKILKIRKEIA